MSTECGCKTNAYWTIHTNLHFDGYKVVGVKCLKCGDVRDLTYNELLAVRRATAKINADIDEARDVSAILVQAYITNSRPPLEAFAKARIWLIENMEAADDIDQD